MSKSDDRGLSNSPNKDGSSTDTTAHKLANAFVIAGTGSEWISAPPEYTVDITEAE